MSRALAVLAFLAPALAHADGVLYRMPVSDCANCSHAALYPTAYKDLDPSTDIKDWSCGTLTYDGHEGTDIAIGGWANMDNGSMQVVAGADGTVVYTHDGENDRCGDGVNGMCGNEPCEGPSGHCGNGDSNSVAIMHADGKVSTYLHMITGSVAVSVGDQVTCGQLLGYVGSSGWSTGPHCHIEIDLGGGYLLEPDDPFASTCVANSAISYWVTQGAYESLPGSLCQGEDSSSTTTTTSGSSTATSSTASSTAGSTTGTGSSSTSTTTSTTTTTTASTTGTTGSGTTGGQGDSAEFVGEIVPDGTTFPPNVTFTKSWTVINDGSTRWDAADDYRLVFLVGDSLGTPTEVDLAASESIDPGRDKTWSLTLALPQPAGTYNQTWQMMHGSTAFGPTLTVNVVVGPSVDADGDGHASIATGGDDCDDNDPTVFPGNPEVCDGKDNNCNGQIDENLDRNCIDACQHQGVQICTVDASGVAGYSACETSESTPTPEICNGEDDDCDGIVDDGAPCPEGQTCRNGSCQPTSFTSGTTSTGTTGASGTSSTSGTSTGTTGDQAASPAGCGCGSGSGSSSGGMAMMGLLALLARRSVRRRD